MEIVEYNILQHSIYVLRWMLLAIPGATFLLYVQKRIKNTYGAMIVSQGILGALVFFLDRFIFSL